MVIELGYKKLERAGCREEKSAEKEVVEPLAKNGT